jgi:hypothetical protein
MPQGCAFSCGAVVVSGLGGVEDLGRAASVASVMVTVACALSSFHKKARSNAPNRRALRAGGRAGMRGPHAGEKRPSQAPQNLEAAGARQERLRRHYPTAASILDRPPSNHLKNSLPRPRPGLRGAENLHYDRRVVDGIGHRRVDVSPSNWRLILCGLRIGTTLRKRRSKVMGGLCPSR